MDISKNNIKDNIEKDFGFFNNDLVAWIRKQRPKWNGAFPIQKAFMSMFYEALKMNSESKQDYIISSPTASGKTEAVFLPLSSYIYDKKLYSNLGFNGAIALYICPLKALIDQQARRLKSQFPDYCPIIPWHGNSSTKNKEEFKRNKKGIVIITPESLEAQFIKNEKETIKEYYGNIKCIVIDEFHSFFNNPRGYQLISQLSRLEYIIDKKISRIALSATFNKQNEILIQQVSRFLRPNQTKRVKFIHPELSSNVDENFVKPNIQVHAFFERDRSNRIDIHNQISKKIQEDFNSILNKNGGTDYPKGLIFTNSRRETESYSNSLRDYSCSECKVDSCIFLSPKISELNDTELEKSANLQISTKIKESLKNTIKDVVKKTDIDTLEKKLVNKIVNKTNSILIASILKNSKSYLKDSITNLLDSHIISTFELALKETESMTMNASISTTEKIQNDIVEILKEHFSTYESKILPSNRMNLTYDEKRKMLKDIKHEILIYLENSELIKII